MSRPTPTSLSAPARRATPLALLALAVVLSASARPR
ncbi:hypothetical protein QFZ49_001339 [Streptomyces turgidiscabies]|uniref:Uncharacterized protein n=1 Tax=Streptomyces turgidiscabies TaxID=85558 RepID=A0ABU0RHG6_9ACTN|nr:hypothetical protein [Streptomyces turgidiscabies]